MPDDSERTQRRSATKRPGAKPNVCGVAGAMILGLVGVGLLGTVVFALVSGEFLPLGFCVGAVSLVWHLTKAVARVWLRILLRAFTFALFLWPFVPHGAVEWSAPWPSAGYWVLLGLEAGKVERFELISILVGTAVMWLAGLAIHRHRQK